MADFTLATMRTTFTLVTDGLGDEKASSEKTIIPSKRRFGDNLAEEERKEGEIGDYISSFLHPL